MNFNIKNSKGAVELSLNLIIMLVIGLTVLGLIIAFVTNFLGKAEANIPVTQDDKVKLDQALRLEGNFALLSSTINIKKDSKPLEAKLYLKVRNPATSESMTLFGGGKVPDTTDNTNGDADPVLKVTITGAGVTTSSTDGETSPKIEVYSGPIVLDAGSSGSYPLVVKLTDKTVEAGTYFITINGKIGAESFTQVATLLVE